MQIPIHCSYDKIVPIGELKPHPKNRNNHPDDQIKRLSKILEYQGFRYPVKVSKLSGYITSGHGRVMAAELMGLKEVPVNFQDYKDEDQEYADIVADNSIASWSEIDLSGVNSDLANLSPDFDLDHLGFKNFKLDLGEDTSQDDIPEKVEPKTKPGNLFKLGNHFLMCGDSTKIADVSKLMQGQLADLVFTDPPYGVNYDGGHADPIKRREKLANDDSTEIYTDSVPLMNMFSKENCALYLWFAATKSLQVLQVLQVLQENNYEIRSWLIWNKNMAQFGAIGAQYKQKHEPCFYAYKKGNAPFWNGPNNEVSVWDIDRASKNEFHPTQKPVELSRRAITNSCPENGIVLDLFGGSGSTLIGAELEGRQARVMELDPGYCDIIIARYEKITGSRADLLSP